MVQLDQLALQDKQGTLAVLDPQDPLELRDLPASKDHQGHGVILEPLALLARKDRPVLRVLQASRETTGYPVPLVNLVQGGTLAHLEVQDYKDPQVLLDSQDLLGNLVLRVPLGP